MLNLGLDLKTIWISALFMFCMMDNYRIYQAHAQTQIPYSGKNIVGLFSLSMAMVMLLFYTYNVIVGRYTPFLIPKSSYYFIFYIMIGAHTASRVLLEDLRGKTRPRYLKIGEDTLKLVGVCFLLAPVLSVLMHLALAVDVVVVQLTGRNPIDNPFYEEGKD